MVAVTIPSVHGRTAQARHRRAHRTRLSVAALVAALGIAAVAALPEPSGADRPAPTAGAVLDPAITGGPGVVEVVVQARAGMAPAALADAIGAAGGDVLQLLPIVDGAEVRITGDGATALAAHDGIVAITLDRGVSFEKASADGRGKAAAFIGSSGADVARARGNRGAGVGVAVIDTGISEMDDLAGRIVHGPDLSGEGTIVDTYGHGTVMAGIIGGSGADSAGTHTGVAPESHVVAVKVAGANGAADVSTLLQAMHWVAAYQDQFDIRVLNLSWGTPSTQDPTVDPLNHAVERLWDQGVVVVVAAGNDGPRTGTVNKPGDDPKVITVGAFDDNGTADAVDDVAVSWTSQGPTAAGLSKPDVVASGRRLVATRSYGSTVETEHPRALVSPSYIRGSGSSQATAVTAGAVALLLADRPHLTPDQVKHLLTSTADPIRGVRRDQQGAGRIDLAEALTTDAGVPQWQPTVAGGLGSIDASRGGRYVETDCGDDGTTDVIVGEIDVRCEVWDGSSWTGSSWTGSSWTGSSWTGSSWTGSSWTGSSWTGSSWTGSSWTGGVWTGSSWTGSSWTGSSWTGSSWTGSSWTGSSWTGSSWTGSSWTSTGAGGNMFATTWWGMHPPAGAAVAGERSDAIAPIDDRQPLR
jgi:serine protease AprX